MECLGVINVTKEHGEYIISVKDDSYVNDVFKLISKMEDITKFTVEDPTLNEIFISVVGDSYE